MIDRLYELNRVLSAVRTLSGAGPARPIPIDSIIRLCRNHVVRGRLPDHGKAIQFAAQLGMLTLIGDGAQLLSDGEDFLSLNEYNYVELSADQIQLLTRNQYLEGRFSGECRRAFAAFSWDEKRGRLIWSELDDAALDTSAWLLDHLCELQILVRTKTGYETTSSATSLVLSFIEEPDGNFTEEKLRQMLLEQEEAGHIGEELAMAFERDRLKSMGCAVQAYCVRRISQIRVNAGYDIDSFSGKTADVFDRFIEVKATRGKDVRFFWSENEMKVAERLRDNYWIYFISGINLSNRTGSIRPLMFQNPIRSILHDESFSKSAQGFLVQSKNQKEIL